MYVYTVEVWGHIVVVVCCIDMVTNLAVVHWKLHIYSAALVIYSSYGNREHTVSARNQNL